MLYNTHRVLSRICSLLKATIIIHGMLAVERMQNRMSGGADGLVGLVVDVAMLLFEKCDEAVHFFGRTVPHFDLVLSSSATHLHRTPVHT